MKKFGVLVFGRNGDEEATRGFQPKEVGKEDAVFFLLWPFIFEKEAFAYCLI